MALEKIRIRKNAGNNLTGLVVTMLLVMGIFYGMFYYVSYNLDYADVTLDDKYQNATNNLLETQNTLESDIDDIQNNFNDIQEAENSAFAVWNGLKGLGNTLKLSTDFVTTSSELWTTLVFMVEGVPGWALALVFIGITGYVVFLVLRILKGEQAVG